jgi:hypothetical protein
LRAWFAEETCEETTGPASGLENAFGVPYATRSAPSAGGKSERFPSSRVYALCAILR